MPNWRSGLVQRSVALLSVAVAGGAIALAGAWLFGGFGNATTTVREIFQTASPPTEVAQHGQALTIGEIYKEAAPGVVQITARVVTVPREPFFGTPLFPQEERALGSGFVLDKAGHIVTNYHVIQGARSIQVSFSNNDSMKARIVGADPATDVAVLRVDAQSRALQPLRRGNSDSVQVGDAVVAIGNPFGFSRSITAGIVSALERRIQSPSYRPIGHVIQTDAAINAGNSGGPLLNASGQVIGVNTAISTGDTGERGNVGIGFAIPINTLNDVASQLIQNGKVEHAFLGVEVKAIDKGLAGLVRLPVDHGLLVERVVRGSAAAKAGMKAGNKNIVVAGESYVIGGDIILKVDGQSVSSFDRLNEVISSKKPGDHVKIELYRGSTKQSLDVTLGRQPAIPPSPG